MNLAEPFLTDPKQIKAWLDSMGVKDWSINGDGLVDVRGDVSLAHTLGKLKRLPVRFGTISGDFDCNGNPLVSLEGAPKKVARDFRCGNNQLVSLEGAPKQVGMDFYCHNNQLVSLEGVPKELGGDFYCSYNQLVSLEGAPENVGGDFYCCCNQLVSLEGAPENVGGDFYCDHNQLVDFKGMEDVSIGRKLVVTRTGGDRQDNVFVSLDGLPKELHSRVVGLDMPFVLELGKKRTARLLGDKTGDLSSEVELG